MNKAEASHVFDFHRCEYCVVRTACLASGVARDQLPLLEQTMTQAGPYQAGETIFSEGALMDAIASVRSGCVKSYYIDETGNEHVLGFHVAGEFIGLASIEENAHPCFAEALQDTELCLFQFPKITDLSAQLPAVQRQLLAIMSRGMRRAMSLGGNWTAEERLAAFLYDFAQRVDAQKTLSERFQLPMTRGDLASYIRLTPETVSRLLRQFQQEGLLEVHGRHVGILDADGLKAKAEPLLAMM